MKTPHTEEIDIIRLARSENVGPATFYRLISVFGNAKNAIEAISGIEFPANLKKKIKIYSTLDLEKEISKHQKFNSQIITFKSEIYPQILKEIPDAPPILSLKGRTDLLKNNSIAIVGTRNPSLNGALFAKKIAKDLSQNSFIITSGLAKGIDYAAHDASLDSGTIAVIAGGINNIYPKENLSLFKKIYEQGLIISEFPFDTAPQGGNFIKRNRIISALSLGVCVIEATLRSGSLTTARFALEQNREIFSVPGSPFDPRCKGTNLLIKKGAKLLESIDDIIEEISPLLNQSKNLIKEPQTTKIIEVTQKMPEQKIINEVIEEILNKLNYTPISTNILLKELAITPRIFTIALIQLELSNLVNIYNNTISLYKS